MTTYYKIYELTPQQRALLKDLLIYKVSQYDQKITCGGGCPYIANRSEAMVILNEIYNNKLEIRYPSGALNDVAELCKTISNKTQKDLKSCNVIAGELGGLISILSAYSSQTVNSLRKKLSSDNNVFMTSTSFSYQIRED